MAPKTVLLLLLAGAALAAAQQAPADKATGKGEQVDTTVGPFSGSTAVRGDYELICQDGIVTEASFYVSDINAPQRPTKYISAIGPIKCSGKNGPAFPIVGFTSAATKVTVGKEKGGFVAFDNVRTGFILDAFTIVAADGTETTVGGTGGSEVGDLTCPEGTRIAGFFGTTGDFSGGPLIRGVGLVCREVTEEWADKTEHADDKY